MVSRSAVSFLLCYAALILQICCGKWMNDVWGRPQWLLLLLVFSSLRNRSGLAVVTGAFIGFLADCFEPSGMGRHFLIYSLIGYWLQRWTESSTLRLGPVTFLGTLALISFLAPASALLMGQILQPRLINPVEAFEFILLSTLWTTLLAIPLTGLFRKDSLEALATRRSSSMRAVGNRWTMLTH